VVVAVEATLSVEFTLAEFGMLITGLGIKLQVMGLVAPDGPVTAQVRATLPVNPFVGVTEIVEVFPLVAPGTMLRFVLLVMVKPCAPDAPLTMAVMPSV
jgi:hypothetical protein